MREDGVLIDSVLLTTDPDYRPSDVVETDGQVAIEAEQFNKQVSGSGPASGSEWVSIEDSGASASTALEAVPNEGVNVGDSTDGPRLDYEVEFNNTGTYYVWVRMRAPGGTDDSIHVGVDDSPVTYGGWGFAANHGDWEWTNERSGTRVTVNVDSTGVHPINIWMREDGVSVDQVLLTTDPDYSPSGAEPTG